MPLRILIQMCEVLAESAVSVTATAKVRAARKVWPTGAHLLHRSAKRAPEDTDTPTRPRPCVPVDSGQAVVGHNDLGGRGTCRMARENNQVNTGNRRWSSDEFDRVLGSVLRHAREGLNWTSVDIAQVTYLPPGQITAIEQGTGGTVSISDLVRFCGAVHVAPATMLAATLQWLERPSVHGLRRPDAMRTPGVVVAPEAIAVFIEALGALLRRRRIQKAMPMSHLAQRVGLPSNSSAVRFAEAATVSQSVWRLYAMCDVLDMSLVQVMVSAQALVAPGCWPDANAVGLGLPALHRVPLIGLATWSLDRVLPSVLVAQPRPGLRLESELKAESPLYAAAGDVLREVRQKMGLLKADVASLIDMSSITVSNAESGTHSLSLDTLLRFALAMRIAPTTLIAAMLERMSVPVARTKNTPASHYEPPSSDLSLVGPFTVALGNILKQVRTDRGLSRHEVCLRLGRTSGRYSRSVEETHERLPLAILLAMCDVLYVPVGSMLTAAQRRAAPTGWPNDNDHLLGEPSTSHAHPPVRR